MEQFWQMVQYVEGLERENAALRAQVKHLTEEVESLRPLMNSVLAHPLTWGDIQDWLKLGRMTAEVFPPETAEV